jgi:hypothetical protein
MALGHGPTVVTQGLVLALDAADRNSYPGSGTTWTDLSGRGNTGTLVNGVGYNSGNGGSLSFDGVNDQVQIINYNQSLYHLNCWIYLNSTITQSSSNGFFNYGSSLQPGVNFGSITGLVSDETLTILYEYPAGTYRRTSITENISSGWNCINFNWNGNSYDIYINSLSKTTTFGVSAGHVPLIYITNLIFGYGYSDSGRFTGNIAQVSIYNRALTASEIQQNFNALRGRFGI